MNVKNIYFKIIKKLRLIYSKNSQISLNAKINAGSEIVNSIIDDYSYCGYDCKILYANIGKFCSIASNVTIGGAKHPLSWVSTSPVFIEGKNTLGVNFAYNKFDEYEKVFIGNDVWIGEGAFLKSGITIGDGAVIGMGSVVTHDVAPYTIVAGNPARIIRKRFDDSIITRLINIKWWDFNEEKLKEYSSSFSEITEFLDKIENE